MAFLLQKMSDILGGGLWTHPPGQVVVHGHHRGLGTSPKTGVHSHSEAFVWSVAFIFHAGGFQDGLEDAHGAYQMAGGTPTNFDHVIGRGFKTEVWVEGCNGPDIVDGGIRKTSDEIKRFFGYVTQFVFDREQRGQYGNGRLRLTVDCVVDPLF
jgi:hypothetical protein